MSLNTGKIYRFIRLSALSYSIVFNFTAEEKNPKNYILTAKQSSFMKHDKIKLNIIIVTNVIFIPNQIKVITDAIFKQ